WALERVGPRGVAAEAIRARMLWESPPPGSDTPPAGEGSVVFSPDGKTLAWCGSNGYVHLRPCDAAGVESEVRFRLSDQAPRALAFDRSGSVLAVGDAAGFLVLCDASTGAIRARHATGQGAINDLEMAPDGNLLASVGSDLRIWNLQLGELLRFTPRD